MPAADLTKLHLGKSLAAQQEISATRSAFHSYRRGCRRYCGICYLECHRLVHCSAVPPQQPVMICLRLYTWTQERACHAPLDPALDSQGILLVLVNMPRQQHDKDVSCFKLILQAQHTQDMQATLHASHVHQARCSLLVLSASSGLAGIKCGASTKTNSARDFSAFLNDPSFPAKSCGITTASLIILIKPDEKC